MHDWIKDNLGLDIPRVAVCDGHESPFQFLADLYFERVTSAVAVANRGGSKTMLSALLHLLNSLFKPGCESMSVGAIEQQAIRAYNNLKVLVKAHGKVEVIDDHPMVQRSVQRETTFKNGSQVEIVPGTPAAVNGPHPHKVHFDEVELADPVVFEESRNMSQSKNGIRAQDWITSTRKRAHGPMQTLLNEIEEAKRAGSQPPYDLYTWCVFESASPVPNCQVANPEATHPCTCDRVTKGTWDDGSPRKFVDVCKGRLARSSGYITLDDIHKLFRNNSAEVWEAQQECTKPESAGLVLPMFDRDRYGVKWFEPNPDNGPIYLGVDFGGTNPHAVNWYQVLNQDVWAYGSHQERSDTPAKLLQAGTRVCFDEFYMAEVSNTFVARKILEKQEGWRRSYPGFRHSKIFADPAAKAARLEFASYDPPLGTAWYTTRDQKEQIKWVKELLSDGLFAVDTTRCPFFCDEAEAWHYPRKQSHLVYDPEIPVDDFNHCMSEFRYVVANLRTMEKRGTGHGKARPSAGAPRAGLERNSTKSGAPRYLPRDQTETIRHPFDNREPVG